MDKKEQFTTKKGGKSRHEIAMLIANDFMYVIDSGDYGLLQDLNEPEYTDKQLDGTVREQYLASLIMPRLYSPLCQDFVDKDVQNIAEALNARDANEALNDLSFRLSLDMLQQMGFVEDEE